MFLPVVDAVVCCSDPAHPGLKHSFSPLRGCHTLWKLYHPPNGRAIWEYKGQHLTPTQDNFEGPAKIQSSRRIGWVFLLWLDCSSPSRSAQSCCSPSSAGLATKSLPQYISCTDRHLRVCFLREPGLQHSLRHDSAEKLKHRCTSLSTATRLLKGNRQFTTGLSDSQRKDGHMTGIESRIQGQSYMHTSGAGEI